MASPLGFLHEDNDEIRTVIVLKVHAAENGLTGPVLARDKTQVSRQRSQHDAFYLFTKISELLRFSWPSSTDENHDLIYT